MTTRERVHEIITDAIGWTGPITDETSWQELGVADVEDLYEWIVSPLEDSFAIEIPEAELESWDNVGQTIAYLEAQEGVT